MGPGDPNLLTVAAVRAIETADVIACPVTQIGAISMAATIAGRWISSHQTVMPLLFPMVQEEAPRRQAWHAAADALAEAVASGRSVVLLCEGDASLFATSSYVLLALQQRHPACRWRVIPGITSFSAAAAAMGWPLALQQDRLLVSPCPSKEVELDGLLDRAEQDRSVLVLLKLGRRWQWVKPRLELRGILEQALFAERVGWPDQELAPAVDVPAVERPYFSLLLVRQRWPSVLP